MASVDDLKQPYSTASPSPIDLPQPPPPPAANISAPSIRPSQSYRALVAFLILAALSSASWFVEQFAAAAGNLRLPMPAAVVIVLLFAALFYASIHFFRSFFLARPPVAAMLQWERIGAIAAVGAGFAACLVAASGFAYRVYLLDPQNFGNVLRKSFWWVSNLEKGISVQYQKSKNAGMFILCCVFGKFWWKFVQFVYDVDRAPVTRSEPSYLSSPDSSKRLQSRYAVEAIHTDTAVAVLPVDVAWKKLPNAEQHQQQQQEEEE
ncbi:unnamed protein product [Miscanthus lutarioriparius]|uniref:Uncharacterized protein n=1 Tax=Miscanthus lutarioriparius TaxID=422564 RepID=A0A811NQC8_9POAL|nr:unnamed protein product [Miscanthus lutarioriparius]